MKYWIPAILFSLYFSVCAEIAKETDYPNIIFIVSEDNGPELGCYGDLTATTPNIDKLASQGMSYNKAWSNAAICAPARTTIISGKYATSLGAQHMRSNIALPQNFEFFTQKLRKLGYYCANMSKTDYSLQIPNDKYPWQQKKGSKGKNSHWRARQQGQAFFAMTNIGDSHESKIRSEKHPHVCDASKLQIPPFYPNIPEVRYDLSRYYDSITAMDKIFGQIIASLEKDGLLENTIIFYFGDHGSGMPRYKRAARNSGLRVPLIVSIPEKWKALRQQNWQIGGSSDQLVSFVDLAPTVLSLAGIKKDKSLAGEAFLGTHSAAPKKYLYGYRGRADERQDLVRSIRDQHFVYMRNFRPDQAEIQFINYQYQTKTTRLWHEAFLAGKCNAAQSQAWQERPSEALYDLRNDPYEIKNLVGTKEHQAKLEELRTALREKVLSSKDAEFYPESEMLRQTQILGVKSPYDMMRHKDALPIEEIYNTALKMTSRQATKQEILQGLTSKNTLIKYWSLRAIGIQSKDFTQKEILALKPINADASPAIRIETNTIIARYANNANEQRKALLRLLQEIKLEASPISIYTSLEALYAIDNSGQEKLIEAELKALPRGLFALSAEKQKAIKQVNDRYDHNYDRLIASIYKAF